MGDTETTPSATPETVTKKTRKSNTGVKNETIKSDKSKSENPAETDGSDDESNWVPKGNNWDNQVKAVDTIIRDPGNSELYALLVFTNNKRSKVLVETCYHKCPYKVLLPICPSSCYSELISRQICKFYESHLYVQVSIICLNHADYLNRVFK